MKLWYLDLGLSDDSPHRYPNEFGSEFCFSTSSLSNYLRRGVRKLRIEVDGFTQIYVQGAPEEASSGRIFEKTVAPRVRFDRGEYAALDGVGQHEYRIAMHKRGWELVAEQFDLPLPTLFSLLDDFREGGYRNEWEMRGAVLEPRRSKAFLIGNLSTTEFRATLRCMRRGEEPFFEEIVYTSLPDELCFDYKLRKLVVRDGCLCVLDHVDGVTWKRDLDEILP